MQVKIKEYKFLFIIKTIVGHIFSNKSKTCEILSKIEDKKLGNIQKFDYWNDSRLNNL